MDQDPPENLSLESVEAPPPALFVRSARSQSFRKKESDVEMAPEGHQLLITSSSPHYWQRSLQASARESTSGIGLRSEVSESGLENVACVVLLMRDRLVGFEQRTRFRAANLIGMQLRRMYKTVVLDALLRLENFCHEEEEEEEETPDQNGADPLLEGFAATSVSAGEETAATEEYGFPTSRSLFEGLGKDVASEEEGMRLSGQRFGNGDMAQKETTHCDMDPDEGEGGESSGSILDTSGSMYYHSPSAIASESGLAESGLTGGDGSLVRMVMESPAVPASQETTKAERHSTGMKSGVKEINHHANGEFDSAGEQPQRQGPQRNTVGVSSRDLLFKYAAVAKSLKQSTETTGKSRGPCEGAVLPDRFRGGGGWGGILEHRRTLPTLVTQNDDLPRAQIAADKKKSIQDGQDGRRVVNSMLLETETQGAGSAPVKTVRIGTNAGWSESGKAGDESGTKSTGGLPSVPESSNRRPPSPPAHKFLTGNSHNLGGQVRALWSAISWVPPHPSQQVSSFSPSATPSTCVSPKNDATAIFRTAAGTSFGL